MKYINANEILPDVLVEEFTKICPGRIYLYSG